MYSRAQQDLHECATCAPLTGETPLAEAVQGYINAADAPLPGVLRVMLAMKAIQTAQELGQEHGFSSEDWFAALKAARPDLVSGDSLNREVFNDPEDEEDAVPSAAAA